MVEIPVRRRGARMEGISERESVPEPQLGKSAKQAAHGAVDKSAGVVHEGIDRADVVVEKVRETVRPVVERAKEVAQPAKEAVKEAVRPAKEAAKRTKRVVEEKAAGIRERTLQLVDQTAHRIEEEGRETRNVLLRGLDFVIGAFLFPVRWAWNTNMNLWKLIPSTAGVILGSLFFFAVSWFVIGELLPWIFEESYEYPEYGRHRFRSEFYDRNIPDGERKSRLAEMMRHGFPSMEGRYEHEEEPGSPDYRSSMGHFEQSRFNKIQRYVDHLKVDNSYRIRREIRHLREQMLGRGGIFKWTYNRFLDAGNSLGRRWNHMSIDAKYALSNAWNALSYYALAPFRTIEHTAERVKRGAEKGWSRVKQRTEDFTERLGEKFESAKRGAQRGAQRVGETLERPVREFERRHEPLFDRNRYYGYDRYERERPYYHDRYGGGGDWFTRRRRRRGDESVVDKASDVFLGSKDYLQEKAGQAAEWTKEKAGEAVEWTREKLPKDLHEFGELISDAMDEMDDQYRSAKESALEEIHELQERIEQRQYERRSPFGWLASWFW